MSPEKNPSLNMLKLATPSPSDRLNDWPEGSSRYVQLLPAPASRSTETRKRSIRRLVFSLRSGGGFKTSQ
jgi:hypothetical protein